MFQFLKSCILLEVLTLIILQSQNKATIQQGDAGGKKPLLTTSPKRKNNLNVKKLPSTSDDIT